MQPLPCPPNGAMFTICLDFRPNLTDRRYLTFMARRVLGPQEAREGATVTLGFLERLRQRTVPAVPPVHEGPSQVRAYWEGLRQGHDLPARAALDPRGLGGILDRVLLVERIGKGLAQVRIGGSTLTELAGTELIGLPLSCLFTPESRPLLALALEEAFTGPAIVEIDLGSDRGSAGLAIARLILLPLRHEGDRLQLLGAIGMAARTRACKLQVLSRRSERLVLPPAPCPPPVPAAEERTVRHHGHLRLVKFDG